MPDKFSVYITDKLLKLGYESTAFASSTIFSSVRYVHKLTALHLSVIYLKLKIDTDGLSYLFQNIPDHLLIVVDSSLIGEDTGLKQWFRALHALYYGRVYVWDNFNLFPLHYDRQSGSFSNGSYIDIKSVRFERVDCLYSGFKGFYNVVLLNDRKFWSDAEKPPSRDTKTNPSEDFWRAQYAASDEAQQAGQQQPKGNAKTKARKDEHFRREQAQREEQKKREEEARKAREREDVFRDFRDAFERNKARYGADNGGSYDPNARPQYARGGVSGDKWFIAIWSDGTRDGAKTAYRALGKQYHPDINKEPGATETMQAINRAYEKVMEIHNG